MLRTNHRSNHWGKLPILPVIALLSASCAATSHLRLVKQVVLAINRHDWRKVYSLSSRRVKRWFSESSYVYHMCYAEETHNYFDVYIFVPQSNLEWQRLGNYALVRLPAARKSSSPPSCTMSSASFTLFNAALVFVQEDDGWKFDNILPVDGLELPNLEYLLEKAPQKIRAGEAPEPPYFSWWANAFLEAIRNAKFPPDKIADVLTTALLLLDFDLFEEAVSILAGKNPNYRLQGEEGFIVASCLGMFRDRKVLSTYLKYLTADFPYLDLCMAHLRSMLPEEAPPISDVRLLAWLANNLPRLDWDEKSLQFVVRTPVRTPVGSPRQVKAWQRKLRCLSLTIKW